MSDLLRRLRQTENVQIPDDTGTRMMRASMHEAADEIERLRKLLNDAEGSLLVYDENQSALYWVDHPERAGDLKE